MKLDAPFIRLPYRFEAAQLATQVDALPAEAWQSHPRGWDGHWAVPLISAGGDDDLTRLEGSMRPTTWLERLPLLTRVLATLDTVPGRTFLVRAEAGRDSGLAVEAGYYWHRRVRVYVPIRSADDTVWRCGEQGATIPPGQTWLINGWQGVGHVNPGAEPLIYLVTDTVGSGAFWSTVKAADRPLDPAREAGMSPRQVTLREDGVKSLETETVLMPRVMSPWEQESLINTVLEEIRALAADGDSRLTKLQSVLDQFARQWQGIWARHGESGEGEAAYRQGLEQLVSQLALFAGAWRLPNGMDAMHFAADMLALHALRDAEGKPVQVIPDQLAQRFGFHGDPQPAAALPKQETAATAGSEQTARAPAQPAADGGAAAQDPGQSPLRSVHTRSLPELLQKIASSLLVTTYQAGKLVVVREDQGRLNTHFRIYNRPMGLIADRGRLALGTAMTVEHYRNMADVAKKLDPPGKHDAAFLPRRGHITGNIDIHEMDFAGDELWLVNTRFSCLCTLDGEHSFVPRWRPPFISGYAPEDRCHLNGLEVVDGKPKYVTALGTADEAGGWRENKAGGGILMDVESSEIICRGLSMPHSPRWYDGKLWVLESGNGTLATVDPATGGLETVCELPGFTRGLDFYGPFAFVGLSQVRESAVFSGISITEKVTERNAGVWVVDLRSGHIVAFLKFEDAVQEVFAVSVLPGIRFPDVLAGNDKHVPISYALPDEALREVVRPASKEPAADRPQAPGGSVSYQA